MGGTHLATQVEKLRFGGGLQLTQGLRAGRPRIFPADLCLPTPHAICPQPGDTQADLTLSILSPSPGRGSSPMTPWPSQPHSLGRRGQGSPLTGELGGQPAVEGSVAQGG